MLQAPAKLNLGLRVGARGAGGLHSIESLFVPLALADRIELRQRASGVRLLTEGPVATPAGRSNLAHQAAQAFLDAARLDAGVTICLRKHIPSPAGLGGGSSDAGAVLRGLAQLHPGALSPGQLAELALQLGADVPFFLTPRPALVSGRGERRLPVEGLPVLHLLLLHPGVGITTALAFETFDTLSASLTPAPARPTLRSLLALREEDGSAVTDALPGLSAEHWRDILVNDLEPAARHLCPVVAELREELSATQARAVGMSGSGPTMFGVFGDARSAHEAAQKLAPRVAQCRVTKTISHIGATA